SSPRTSTGARACSIPRRPVIPRRRRSRSVRRAGSARASRSGGSRVPQFSFEGLEPQVHPDAFVAPTATLVGDVTVEAGASVWYGAVLRADYSPVIVREGANVQDGSILHGPPGVVTEVGPHATVAHLCVVHGAVLEEECLVANGCTVLDGARIGARSLIAAHSLVASN